MKRIALLVVAFAVPVAFAEDKKDYPEPEDFTCYVQRTMPDGSYDAGSGTVVGCENCKSLILSCAHVLHNGTDSYIVRRKGKEWTATFGGGSRVTEKANEKGEVTGIEIDGPDLSLLVVEVELPAAVLASEAPKKGDRLRQYGFAGGEWENGPFLKIGKVKDPSVMTTWIDARGGDSGCAMFDAAGNVVGVTSARPANPLSVGSLAVPLSDIKTFLSKAVKKSQFPKLYKSLSN